MPKRLPSSLPLHRPPAEAEGGDLPCTCNWFGAPPRTLSSALWQILPQLAAGGVVLLTSCAGGEGP